jgi:Na+/proline symporter
MDMPNKRDWFNVGAIAPFSVVLFTCAFGLFTRSVMSLQADILWTIGIIVIAFLVWLNAAKTQQRAAAGPAAPQPCLAPGHTPPSLPACARP